MERTEAELKSPIMTREEFEEKQFLSLYEEKVERAGELWSKVLSEMDGLTHPMKWQYLEYLEKIKYKDQEVITLEEVKEEILSYEEFVEMRESEYIEK